jgi:hypothetical protein
VNRPPEKVSHVHRRSLMRRMEQKKKCIASREWYGTAPDDRDDLFLDTNV